MSQSLNTVSIQPKRRQGVRIPRQNLQDRAHQYFVEVSIKFSDNLRHALGLVQIGHRPEESPLAHHVHGSTGWPLLDEGQRLGTWPHLKGQSLCCRVQTFIMMNTGLLTHTGPSTAFELVAKTGPMGAAGAFEPKDTQTQMMFSGQFAQPSLCGLGGRKKAIQTLTAVARRKVDRPGINQFGQGPRLKTPGAQPARAAQSLIVKRLETFNQG